MPVPLRGFVGAEVGWRSPLARVPSRWTCCEGTSELPPTVFNDGVDVGIRDTSSMCCVARSQGVEMNGSAGADVGCALLEGG
jgi:hypothetical protein